MSWTERARAAIGEILYTHEPNSGVAGQRYYARACRVWRWLERRGFTIP
jgi:hypothetical protein